MRLRIAVVGAGVAGAICARTLAEAGQLVTVFEEAGAIGGRLAQRRHAGAVFDHGAQYLRPRDPVLAKLLEAGVMTGTVARWPAAEHDGRPVYVGRPAMATPFAPLLAEVPTLTGRRVDRLARAPEGWWLEVAGGGRRGPFDRVAVAIPAPAAHDLLAASGDAVPAGLPAAARRAVMAPCWALLLAFDPPLPLAGCDARAFDDGPIAWLARNTSKPGRDGLDSWTVHASPDWSTAHLDAPSDAVAARLLAAFRAVTGSTAAPPVQIMAHRWRHALVTTPVGEPALFDRPSGLGLCGDWCLGGRIEAAYHSGRALAGLLPG